VGTRTVWHGTVEEADELREILRRNCVCGVDGANPNARCAAHAMLLLDQRALDGLLFVRHIVAQLVGEEFNPLAPTPTATREEWRT
jgi:hypothetical protein